MNPWLGLVLIGVLASCQSEAGIGAAPASDAKREPVAGGPCEGCEHVFAGQPATMASRSRLAPAGEPGEALRVDGVVRDAQGQPKAGVVVYAYHTDSQGIYPRGDTRHGSLRGWARTDAQGRYRFDTIRPAAYPNQRMAPQHIHMHVIEPGRCTYWIGDVYFEDDPLLGADERARQAQARGGSGLARPQGSAAAGWSVRRDIQLGLNVPGYADCGVN